jgi:hypothetical protein
MSYTTTNQPTNHCGAVPRDQIRETCNAVHVWYALNVHVEPATIAGHTRIQSQHSHTRTTFNPRRVRSVDHNTLTHMHTTHAHNNNVARSTIARFAASRTSTLASARFSSSRTRWVQSFLLVFCFVLRSLLSIIYSPLLRPNTHSVFRHVSSLSSPGLLNGADEIPSGIVRRAALRGSGRRGDCSRDVHVCPLSLFCTPRRANLTIDECATSHTHAHSRRCASRRCASR